MRPGYSLTKLALPWRSFWLKAHRARRRLYAATPALANSLHTTAAKLVRQRSYSPIGYDLNGVKDAQQAGAGCSGFAEFCRARLVVERTSYTATVANWT